MNGAEYIAEFLCKQSISKVFTVTGGACAFIIDAIARNQNIDYICFHHEQSAAMAADAVWRVTRKPGVTVVTSGPGATNLITGIACSYFDSIPSIHITGQVNKSESMRGVNARQIGFQETNIVDMVKPITKYAVQVNDGKQLQLELTKAYHIAVSDRMGPVLIDVPMNVQKEELDDLTEDLFHEKTDQDGLEEPFERLVEQITIDFQNAKRPLILFGAGIGLAGVESQVSNWIHSNNLPFVSSWGGSSYFDHDISEFCGLIGVYGNRGANFIIQNCDYLLVLGSRLDSRQRSGIADSFVPNAKVQVIDIDIEELKKYSTSKYKGFNLDLKLFPEIMNTIIIQKLEENWRNYISLMKKKFFRKNISTFALKNNSLSPYQVIEKINEIINDDAIIIPECGANLCWVYQIFHRKNHTIFTAYGNSPMGYTLPASIGASIFAEGRQVIGILGDGGFQMNIQELQTMIHYNLDIKIVILNNFGYGIIKQFQDSYFQSRYEATGRGYSQPSFKRIAKAYDIDYVSISSIDEITVENLSASGIRILDIFLDPNTLIEPKLEMGNPINNQFPYLPINEIEEGNHFIE